MADFILDFTTDSGSLSFPKIDGVAPPPGANPDAFVSSSNWNAINQAVVDIRQNIISGSIFGFGARYSNPSAVPTIPGHEKLTTDYLYVRTDGALVQHKRDGTEFVLAAAAANAQYTQFAEIDTLPTPLALPALTQGSAIIYLRSNGESTPGLRRTQFVVRWGTDNSDTVIAEGPAY
jgi:hypothetical protein